MIWKLCPDGATRQVVRFTGGLLVLCALLRPLADWKLPDDLWDAAWYRAAVAESERELAREAQNAFSSGIARELEAYIEDKADSMGIRVRVEVITDSRGVPESVTLYGAYCESLSEVIASELGIAEEKQIWIEL